MGLIWDLIQQCQISNQSSRANTLDQRVANLERELRRTQERFLDLLHILEGRLKVDLDGDGRAG